MLSRLSVQVARQIVSQLFSFVKQKNRNFAVNNVKK